MSKYSNYFYIVYNYDEVSLPVALFQSCNELSSFFGKKKSAMLTSISNYKCHRIKCIERKTDNKQFIVKCWRETRNGNIVEY